MEDEVVKKIVSNIIKAFKDAYGHCGEAQGENMSMLNTTRKDGSQIIIKIEIKD